MAGIIHYSREREYAMTIAEAWRLLADTNHLNRSIGLPSVTFSPLDGAKAEFVREARTRAYGIVPLRWKEYPFAWVRERHYTVRREYEGGPVRVVEGGVELQPSGNGVTVRAFADFTPANFTGRVFWRFGGNVVDNTLKFCDVYLSRREQGLPDPTPPAGKPSIDERQLQAAAAGIEAHALQANLLGRLQTLLREASDDRVLRMRAYAVADAWGADRAETLRLFLRAAHAGLLQLAWQLMCPNCRVPKEQSASLQTLPARFHCDTCGIRYDTELDRLVELRFSVHPRVRRASDAIYCIGGPLRMPHVIAQQYLRANESRSLLLPPSDTGLRLRAAGGGSLLIAPAPPARRPEEVSLIYAAGKWSGPFSRMRQTADGETLDLPSGHSLLVRNQSAGAVLAIVEDVRWSDEAITAAAALNLPEFLRLFPDERWDPALLAEPAAPLVEPSQ